MNNPKVSIIIPLYNKENFIVNTLKSVVNQTFTDWEVIIVNDCSTDRSLEIVKEYIRINKNKRIRLLQNKKNLGRTKTRNVALRVARGKYISFLDADDQFMPKKLEIQNSYLDAHPDVFLLGTSARVVDTSYKKVGVMRKIHIFCWLAKKRLLKSDIFVTSSVMFRNEGFLLREDYTEGDDWSFWMVLRKANKKMKNLFRILTIYVNDPNGCMANSVNNTKEYNSFWWNKFYKEFIYPELKK